MAEQQEFEVIFYQSSDNITPPALEFIESCNLKMQAKIFSLLEILQEKGNHLREPYSKPLADGLFELRIKQGSDISRMLYFFFVGKKIVITHGFIKKSQKTPKAEIERAKKYRKDFLERRKSDGGNT